VIHNGVALDRFLRPVDPGLRSQLSDATDRIVFLTVARLDEQKGHEGLLRVEVQLIHSEATHISPALRLRP